MADVKLVRVDSRLAHSKVVNQLRKGYDFKTCLIANDMLANDEFKKEVMDLTIDQSIDRVYKNMGDAIEFLKNTDESVIVIVENSTDLEKIVKNTEVEEVNIGISHLEEGKKSLTELIAASDFDLDIYKDIYDRRINIYLREYPKDPKIGIEKFIK